MIDVAVGTRMVLVLGRGRLRLDPARCVAQAADRGVPLVVLGLGFPTTGHQQGFVTQAVDRAFELRVPMDAELVMATAEIPERLRPDDDVTIVATGREERDIGSAITR